MPITCSICQKVCANQRGLNIHISRKHRQDGITDHGGKADKGTTVQGYCSGITENHESNFNEEIYDTHRQRPSTIHHQGPHIIEGNDDKHRQRPSTFDSKHRRGPSTIEENEEKYRRRTSTLEENDEKHRTEKATPATCGICQREFKNERGLSVHMSRKHKQGDRHDHKEPRRITTTIEDNDNKHRPRPSSIEENDDKYRQRRSSIEENDDKLRRRPSSIEENYNKHRRRTSSVEENDDKLRRRTSSTGGKDESTEKSDGKPSPRSTVEDDRKFPTVKRMHNACCSHCGDADGGSTKSRLLENHISITSPSNSSLPFHVTNVTKYIAMLEGEIKIRRKDNASTRKGVNEFIESLNKAMDGISNIPLKMLNSGSYYDKTS
ncbi:uncharacterized protein LOC134252226, partial [Saccostrea cucullata]|uniref:uncharacterized protein LOC134252226 n=1 Tax=Saccostrea cuccullata TaxID=36930 RepID=UPI002ED245BA